MDHLRTSILCLAGAFIGCTTLPAFAQGMGQGGWHVSQRNDPMTDATVTRAAREYVGTQFNVQVEVICTRGNLSYTFRTYNTSGRQAATLRTIGTLTPYSIRLDSEPAVSAFGALRNYSNEFKFVSGQIMLSSDPEEVAQAQRVLVQINLTTGTTLITIDQSDPRLRFVLNRCVTYEGLSARRRRLEEERQRVQRAAQGEAERRTASERAETQRYAVSTTGMHYRSEGDCSFEEFGSVEHKRCVFFFSTDSPETAERMIIHRLRPQTHPGFFDVYRFNITGETAYAAYSDREGANERRYGQLRRGGRCWVGETVRICIRPGRPRLQQQ